MLWKSGIAMLLIQFSFYVNVIAEPPPLSTKSLGVHTNQAPCSTAFTEWTHNVSGQIPCS